MSGPSNIERTNPKNIMPDAKTIIVLMEAYFRESFPSYMESHFGRCYLDEEIDLDCDGSHDREQDDFIPINPWMAEKSDQTYYT